MNQNWEECLKAILAEEGGNDDDPHDPGGRTSRGILQREYNAWCRLHQKPGGDVWKASDADVAAIYNESYWLPWCPLMPNGMDLEFFDMSVNAGVHEAIILLQRCFDINADGHIGVITKAAFIHAMPVPFVKAYSEKRRAYYKSLKTYKYFGHGWMNRVATIEQHALKLAKGG